MRRAPSFCRNNLNEEFPRAAVALGAIFFGAAAVAAQSSNVTWMPPVPGTVVQQSSVAFNGESAASQGRAIVSKQLVGSGNGQSFLSMVPVDLRRRGRARTACAINRPRAADLSRTSSRRTARRCGFRLRSIRIVGVAQLMRPARAATRRRNRTKWPPIAGRRP